MTMYSCVKLCTKPAHSGSLIETGKSGCSGLLSSEQLYARLCLEARERIQQRIVSGQMVRSEVRRCLNSLPRQFESRVPKNHLNWNAILLTSPSCPEALLIVQLFCRNLPGAPNWYVSIIGPLDTSVTERYKMLHAHARGMPTIHPCSDIPGHCIKAPGKTAPSQVSLPAADVRWGLSTPFHSDTG